MDHIVYLKTATEIARLLSGEKTMLARSSRGRKPPFGHVARGDTVFFLGGLNPKVRAMARVRRAVSAEAEAIAPDIRRHGEKILSPGSPDALLGKRYVVLVELERPGPIVPFTLAGPGRGSPGDWVVLDDIDEAIA